MKKIGNLIAITTFIGMIIILLAAFIFGSKKVDDITGYYILVLFTINFIFIIVFIFNAFPTKKKEENFKTIGIMFLNIPIVFVFFNLLNLAPNETSLFEETIVSPVIIHPYLEPISNLVNHKPIDRGLFIDTTKTLNFKKYFNNIKQSKIVNSNNINKPIHINYYDYGMGHYPQEVTNYPINEEYGCFIYYSMRAPSFFPLFKTEINGYTILAFSIDITSTSTISNKMYILSFSRNGKYIDGVKTYFSYGKGDIKLYRNSNFVKNYNHAGYTEIYLDDDAILYHDTSLRVFNNGSEVIYASYAECRINDNGLITIHEEEKEEMTYYKNGSLNNRVKKKVKIFK